MQIKDTLSSNDPLISYKSFQRINFGNSSVEDYENYKHNYALGVVNDFYTNNRMYEWFHERYNPHKYREVLYSYIYSYIYIYTHTHTHTHAHTYTYTHTYTHTYTQTYTQTHLCTHLYTYTYTNTYNNTYTVSYTHTYTYAYIYIYIYIFWFRLCEDDEARGR